MEQFHLGHHRNAEPLGHQAGDHLVLLGLIGDAGGAPRIGEQPVHHPAQAGLPGEVDHGIGQRLGQVHRPPARQGMVLGGDEHQLLADHRHRRQRQGRVGLGAEDQVALPVEQALHQPLGPVGVEGEGEVPRRVGRQELRRQLRDVPAAQPPQKAQADEPLPPGAAAEGLHPLLQGAQGLVHRGEEGLPKGGQGGVPAGLFKQRHPQLALQLPDGVAEAGLGDAQLLGRPGVVLHLGQAGKVAQMV